jgi:MtfA peptidase
MGFLRRMRRASLLKGGLLPDRVWESLLREHPILDGLDPEEARLLRELATLFLREKSFEAAKGFELTEYMAGVISVQACLPILRLGMDWYDGWKSLIVVPDTIEERSEVSGWSPLHGWSLVHEMGDDLSGEVLGSGTVALSWRDVEDSGWGEGFNVVIHEAAHHLDGSDGLMNGRPALHGDMDPGRWTEVFTHAYRNLGTRARRRKTRSRIDPYALESDSEFFAVASEYFFEQPGLLSAEYAGVYRLLSAFYRQDPASRLRRAQ